MALRDLYTEARRHINEDVKQLEGNSVATAKKDWYASQRALLGQLRAVMDFANA